MGDIFESYSSTFGIRIGGILNILLSIPGNHKILGFSGVDVLSAGSYSDSSTILGRGGNDTLYGLYGKDRILGGDGDDMISGGPGLGDYLFGEAGNDTIAGDGGGGGGDGADHIYGGSGDDHLMGDGGADTLVGGDRFGNSPNDGNDILEGGDGDDFLAGGGGNDALYGGNGRDIFQYTVGEEISTSPGLADTLSGGADTDRIKLQGSGVFDFRPATISGIEEVQLYKDASVLFSSDQILGGINSFFGSIGKDIVEIYGETSADYSGLIFSNWGADDQIILNGSDVIGTSLNDIFRLTGNAHVEGGSGRDIFEVDSIVEASFIDGGLDVDTLNLRSILSIGANIDLSSGIWGSVILSIGTISNVENVIGTQANDSISGNSVDNGLAGLAGNDYLFGGEGSDSLNGGTGNDRLDGGAGSDTVIGGRGRDVLTGGADEDKFVFTSEADSRVGSSRDLIIDFLQLTDRLDISSIDAVAGGSDDSFVFLGETSFSGTAGELVYRVGATRTVVSVDTDGDAIADFEIGLSGQIAITATDFIL